MINLLPVEKLNPEELDREWIELILQAKQIGLTKEQISSFLLHSIPKK